MINENHSYLRYRARSKGGVQVQFQNSVQPKRVQAHALFIEQIIEQIAKVKFQLDKIFCDSSSMDVNLSGLETPQ